MKVSRVTLAQIAEALGVHRTSAMRRAAREGWAPIDDSATTRSQLAYALADLPKEVRKAVQAHALHSAVAKVSPPVTSTATAVTVSTPAGESLPLTASPAVPFSDLTDKERLTRDARSGVLAAAIRLQEASACSQEAALTTLLTSARAGRLDAATDRMLRLARDPRGRQGDGYPSVRTLKRWLGAPDLADRKSVV